MNKLTNPKQVNLMMDSVFKAAVLDESCRGYLIRLVNLITKIDKEVLKENLTIINNESSVQIINEKRKTKDIVLSYRDGIINLEMNRFYYESLIIRNTNYITGLHSTMHKTGEKYIKLKSIQINIDSFRLFDDDLLVHEIYLRDNDNNIYTDSLIIYHVELEKIYKKCYTKADKELVKLLQLFTERDVDKLKKIVKGDKDMENVYNKLVHITYDELPDSNDEYWDEIAKKEIREQGVKEGISINKIDIAKNLFKRNIPIKDISEITGLSISELNNIK